jgi:hypothetical protein
MAISVLQSVPVAISPLQSYVTTTHSPQGGDEKPEYQGDGSR